LIVDSLTDGGAIAVVTSLVLGATRSVIDGRRRTKRLREVLVAIRFFGGLVGFHADGVNASMPAGTVNHVFQNRFA